MSQHLFNTIVVFLLFSTNKIHGYSVVLCDLEDEVCISKGARGSFQNVVSGVITGAPCDPIFIANLDLTSPNFKFTLYNATMTGLLSCDVIHVKMFTKEQKYTYKLACGHITVEAKYYINGSIDDVFLEGNGSFKSVHNNYYITYRVDYYTPVDEGNVTHLVIKKYKMELNPSGELTYAFDNLFDGDSVKSAEALRKLSRNNWETVEEVLNKPTMYIFMDKVIGNVNKFLKIVPIDKIFYYFQ